MASISYPSPTYNGGSVTDLEYERLVSQQVPDGLIGHPSDQPMVFADGTGTRRVNVRANRRALVRGFQYDSGPVEIPLTLDPNTSGATRFDLIVLRLDRSTWRVTEAVVKGTPGSGVPAATMNTGATGVWELPLVSVQVVNGAGALAAGTVTPLGWYLGEDGIILCTASTRPPFAAGRIINQTDTGDWLLSAGSAGPWRTTVQDDTSAVTLPAGWAASINVLHRRNGWCLLTMVVRRTASSGAPDVDHSAGALPVGYRPPYQVYFPASPFNATARGHIEPDGSLLLQFDVAVAVNNPIILAVTYPVA